MRPDIIVGIPSWREADAIGRTVYQIDQGLERAFGRGQCLIVNVDNESDDGTRDMFLQTRTDCPKLYVSTGNQPRGKGKNVFELLRLGLRLGARYITTIDADVVTLTPDWPVQILEPLISRDKDYTVPVYSRNRFEGSTTNHFAFPLLYGLFGANIRQPIGGEFGLTQRLAEYLLQQDHAPPAAEYGIDIFMTCHAVAGGFPIQEVVLGRKLHKPSFPKITSMFAQVVATAFYVVRCYRDQLRTVPFPCTIHECAGGGIDAEQKPPPADAVQELLRQATEKFCASLERGRGKVSGSLDDVARQLETATPEISPALWASFMADCTFCVLESDDPLEELVDLLTPVFLCRAATLWRSAALRAPAEVEQEIRYQAELVRRAINHHRQKLLGARLDNLA